MGFKKSGVALQRSMGICKAVQDKKRAAGEIQRVAEYLDGVLILLTSASRSVQEGNVHSSRSASSCWDLEDGSSCSGTLLLLCRTAAAGRYLRKLACRCGVILEDKST